MKPMRYAKRQAAVAIRLSVLANVMAPGLALPVHQLHAHPSRVRQQRAFKPAKPTLNAWVETFASTVAVARKRKALLAVATASAVQRSAGMGFVARAPALVVVDRAMQLGKQANVRLLGRG